MEAADGLFGELGFDATTTREISERSGMNKALIHYHFQSKDDLLEALLAAHYADLNQCLVAAVAGVEAPEARLRAALGAYVDFLVSHQNFARVVQREIVSGRNVEAVADRTAPLFALLGNWLMQAFPQTAQGPLSAQHLLLSFYGMTAAYFVAPSLLARLTQGDPLGPEAIAARKAHLLTMMDLVLAALRSNASVATAT